ncbi:major capsid protein [Vogesella sp. LYT5W]|uniref:Major capsid protein n=1 Tax=Vogesella margarita TaxID=2984199 RepID=A0ABT5IRG6_9NEIS|nr:major capsid protein [Vogesella margarita]MDC7715147.1 major capsid protein [Vogesella margarita]
MKFRSVALRFGAKVSAATAATFGLMASAQAAVPAAVTTAITDAGTDAATVGGLVLVVIVGIASFKYLRKAL